VPPLSKITGRGWRALDAEGFSASPAEGSEGTFSFFSFFFFHGGIRGVAAISAERGERAIGRQGVEFSRTEGRVGAFRPSIARHFPSRLARARASVRRKILSRFHRKVPMECT